MLFCELYLLPLEFVCLFVFLCLFSNDDFPDLSVDPSLYVHIYKRTGHSFAFSK